jgi:hypothetical protein
MTIDPLTRFDPQAAARIDDHVFDVVGKANAKACWALMRRSLPLQGKKTRTPIGPHFRGAKASDFSRENAMPVSAPLRASPFGRTVGAWSTKEDPQHGTLHR